MRPTLGWRTERLGRFSGGRGLGTDSVVLAESFLGFCCLIGPLALALLDWLVSQDLALGCRSAHLWCLGRDVSESFSRLENLAHFSILWHGSSHKNE